VEEEQRLPENHEKSQRRVFENFEHSSKKTSFSQQNLKKTSPS